MPNAIPSVRRRRAAERKPVVGVSTPKMRLRAAICTPALLLMACAAAAQPYPAKTIRMVTGSTGSGIDVLARLITPGLTSALGQSVIVENRSSAIIPAQTVSRSTPDGYTLLVHGTTFWMLPLLQDKIPYDPIRDFAPITLAMSAPAVLVVPPSTPIKSVSELIALAKAKPGQLNYASALTGSVNHLAAELFKAMAGVDIVRITYNGTGPAINALLGAEVQLSFANAAAAMPLVRSGRLRALAVTSAAPSALLPGLPTVAASGLPGYETENLNGVFAPARTPAAVITRLNQEIVRILNRPEVKERLLNSGVEPKGSTPEFFAAAIKADMARMGKVINSAGIKAE